MISIIRRNIVFGVLDYKFTFNSSFRFEDSALFETPPQGRSNLQKARQPAKKREINDPFEGLEKYGINIGNENDENAASKKRRR